MSHSMKFLVVGKTLLVFSTLALLSGNGTASPPPGPDGPSSASQGVEGPISPLLKIPDLITFWSFQEPAGTSRRSTGRFQYELTEMNGPIERANDGVFGPYCADLEWGQWFRIPRASCPGLDLHGEGQQVTMVAWIKRESDRLWQFIAGVWDEGDKGFIGQPRGEGPRAPARQYAMFISGAWQNDYTSYERTAARDQAMGYVSSHGGATPGATAAFDYATGKTRLKTDRWYMLAYTYDGKWISVYVDGELDSNGNYNPFSFDGPIHDGRRGGADFTVAQRDHPHWPHYPEGVADFEEGFDGRIGGLAVYDRALSSDEIRSLYDSTKKGMKH